MASYNDELSSERPSRSDFFYGWDENPVHHWVDWDTRHFLEVDSTYHDTVSSKPAPLQKHKCPFCDTESTRHHNLKSHLLTHSQDRPFVCATCQMRFRTLYDLNRHRKLHFEEKHHVFPNSYQDFRCPNGVGKHLISPPNSYGSLVSNNDDETSSPAEDYDMKGIVYDNSHSQDAVANSFSIPKPNLVKLPENAFQYACRYCKDMQHLKSTCNHLVYFVGQREAKRGEQQSFLGLINATTETPGVSSTETRLPSSGQVLRRPPFTPAYSEDDLATAAMILLSLLSVKLLSENIVSAAEETSKSFEHITLCADDSKKPFFPSNLKFSSMFQALEVSLCLLQGLLDMWQPDDGRPNRLEFDGRSFNGWVQKRVKVLKLLFPEVEQADKFGSFPSMSELQPIIQGADFLISQFSSLFPMISQSVSKDSTDSILMETFRRAMERQQRAVKPDIPLPSFEFSTTGDRCDSSEISPTSDMKPTSDYSTPRQSVVNADGFNSQILQERLSMESSLDLPSPARTRSLSCGVSSSEDTEFAYAWLSPYSEDVPDIEEDHPLFHLRSPFLETAMAAFERGNSQPMDQGNQRNSGETPGRGQEEMSNPTGSRKRSRYSDHPANEDCDRLSTGYHGPRRTRDRRLCLACPFSKKDPVRYRDCYRYMLSRVRDVKQHLARCHRMPLYCPRCMEIFDDEVVRDSHIRSLSCPENPLVGIEGVSEGQKAMLSRRVSSKMTEEQQWYTVFDILFPGHPRPRSPYVDRELSEEMYVFRDFLTSQGPLLLSAFLESRQIVTWNLPQEERDLATFQETILADGLQLIFERWASVNTGARSSSNAPSTSAASQARDSAIAMQDVSTPAPGLDSSQMSSQTNASNDRHSPGPGADTSLTALSRLTGSDIFSSSEISGQELGGDGYMQLPQSEYFDFTSEWSC